MSSLFIGFWLHGFLKIFEQNDDLLSNKGACRTAPATPGLKTDMDSPCSSNSTFVKFSIYSPFAEREETGVLKFRQDDFFS